MSEPASIQSRADVWRCLAVYANEPHTTVLCEAIQADLQSRCTGMRAEGAEDAANQRLAFTFYVEGTGDTIAMLDGQPAFQFYLPLPSTPEVQQALA